MIIFGWRTRESVVGEGAFGCPVCRTRQGYHHLAHSRWFTLYFIPLIPLGRVGEQVECQGCHSRFVSEVLYTDALSAVQNSEALEATVLDDVESSPPKVAPPLPAPLPQVKLQPQAKPQALAAGHFGPLPPTLPKTSSWAITSLILGLLSPLLLCLFGLSLLTSLGAVVSGHLALRNINRSPRPLTGQGLAIAGLVLGYLMLALSAVTWVSLGPAIYQAFREAGEKGRERPQTNEDRLLAAELRVLTPSTDGVATGNTLEAKTLASQYSQSLASMRTALFTKDRERKFALSDGQFVVHCEQHPGRVAFIVHVPSYRDFAQDAKDELADRAWELAQKTVQRRATPGDELAVGLRGSVRYGAVMVGKVGGGETAFTRVERAALVAYFPPAVIPVEFESTESTTPPTAEATPPVAAPTARAASQPASSALSPSAVAQTPPGPPQMPPGFGAPPVTGQPPTGFAPPGFTPPAFTPPPGFVPPPGFAPPPAFGPPAGVGPPSGFGAPQGAADPAPPTGIASSPNPTVPQPPLAEREATTPAAGRPSSARRPAPARQAETLDEIVALLKEGEQPSFGRLYLPLNRLRNLPVDSSRREEVAELLDPLLMAENDSVRRSAQDAIQVWGTPKNVPTLMKLLDAADWGDRGAAMEALGKLGGSKEAAQRLADLLLDPNESLRAKRALEEMGSVAEDAVWKHVGHADNLIHTYACQALAKVGTSKSLAKLKSRKREREIVRQVPIDMATRELDQRLRRKR